MRKKKCENCQRSNYYYMVTCNSCGFHFCDNCAEKAAEAANKMRKFSSSLVMSYSPVCPKCSSDDVKY